MPCCMIRKGTDAQPLQWLGIVKDRCCHCRGYFWIVRWRRSGTGGLKGGALGAATAAAPAAAPLLQ